MTRRHVGPTGDTVVEDIRRQQARNNEYRKVRAKLARAEAVARLLIQFRMKHDLTQAQLARLMRTSKPTISRLESGAHVPSLTTLSRLAEAAGARLVIGFEKNTGASLKSDRTLVAV